MLFQYKCISTHIHDANEGDSGTSERTRKTTTNIWKEKEKEASKHEVSVVLFGIYSKLCDVEVEIKSVKQ